MILGFDLSTTVCGYCIMNYKGEILEINYHTFNKEHSMTEKGVELENLINDCVNGQFDITHFFIEERLKSFRAGGTNAEAMLKTAQMNYLCQFLFHKKDIEVQEINVNSARSSVFPGFHKYARQIKGIKQKEIAFKFAVEFLGGWVFPTKVKKSGKNKGKEEFIEQAKDMADAWIIAKAGLNLYGKTNS
jgi:hypothetical protein